MPKFGDNAQRELALNRRAQAFTRAIIAGDPNLTTWPEWLVAVKQAGISPRAKLDDLIYALPAPSYLQAPRRGAPASKWSKYRRAWRSWNRPYGGAYRALMRELRAAVELSVTHPEMRAAA